jgi:anionic cell wall polymer biosynthesis LytR-Cps2A-Psr (LCP) family protein
VDNIFKKNKKDYLGWIILIFIIILIISTIYISSFFKGQEKIKIKFEKGQVVSFLCGAYDDNKIIKGMFVFLYNSKTNRCAVASILPRTYLQFQELGYHTLEETLIKKIKYEDILKAVSKLIGMNIDYYAFIQKKNVINFVDILGGVEIFSEGFKYPSINVNIPDGIVLLDGEKAIEYLSFILKDEDEYEYRQLKRIQNFISGMLKLKEDFLDLFNEQVIIAFFYKMVSTNLSANEVKMIFNEIKEKYKSGEKDFSKGLKSIILYCDKKMISADNYLYQPKNSGDWIRSEMKEAVEILNNKETNKDYDNISLEILNGTDINGLGAKAKNFISSYGFDILSVGNSERKDYNNTVVIYYGPEQKAKKLADLIHCQRIIIGENISDKKIDLTLILGKDFDGRVVR